MRSALLRRLARDQRGVTVIEFAIIAPVMTLSMMGLGDLLHQSYVQSVLNGAIQKAGRDSTVQDADTSSIDNKIMAVVRSVAKDATSTSSRRSFTNFVRVGPEPFTDQAPFNGIREAGECFDDINDNGRWDADPSGSGQGGASDVTLYEITVSYTRPFPVTRMLGGVATQTISAHTVLKNQPFASQAISTPETICT